VVAINPYKIAGKWSQGVALDLHTLSSIYLGVNEYGHEVYDTKRSDIGELLYRLKYRGDAAAADEIAKTAAEFVTKQAVKFDLIVPVPPSGVRALQPVITIARRMGELLGIRVVECVSTTRPTAQLKGVIDPDKRKELLSGLYAVDARQTEKRNVLLFDDLYRSGSTLNAITDLLMGAGQANSVSVLTVTRTRSNQ